MFKEYLEEILQVREWGGTDEADTIREQISDSFKYGKLTWDEAKILKGVIDKLF